MLRVAGTLRTVAALVVDADPGYTILLGRHWMRSVKLQGDYYEGTYTLESDEGGRRQLEQSHQPQLNWRIRRVATKQNPMVRVEHETSVSEDDMEEEEAYYYEADTEDSETEN